MNFLTASYTDVGIKKETNQDSMCLKIADTSIGKVVLAIICDGMGGLEKGEVASASVINAFSNWFEQELPLLLSTIDLKDILNDMRYQWNRIIQKQNQKIAEYGRNNRIQLGTTLTALMIIDNEHIFIGHVGDSRAYRINNEINVLTEDQTVVGREVRNGNMTPEQAENDPRRNVLLQCIGASKVVEPDFILEKPNVGEVYMLCSDGFRHKITSQEIINSFKPEQLEDEVTMEQRIKELIEINKQRQETDNITVILIKIQ